MARPEQLLDRIGPNDQIDRDFLPVTGSIISPPASIQTFVRWWVLAEVEYFRIKNWEKYQHHDHKKTMPWVKYHVSLLDDPTFASLDQLHKLTWTLLLLLCGRTSNELLYSSAWIKLKLGLSRKPDLALFESLGLIEKIPTGRAAVEPPLPTGIDLDKRKKDLDRSVVESITSKSDVDIEYLKSVIERNKNKKIKYE